tara:strand:- start:225 stop:443 length:219 start_codon:yes stop_codon:yes gene_type:complete
MGQKIRIDEIDYDLDSLSEDAKASLLSLEFITKRVQELTNMRALLQRARNSYLESLKKEVISDKSGLLFNDD